MVVSRIVPVIHNTTSDTELSHPSCAAYCYFEAHYLHNAATIPYLCRNIHLRTQNGFSTTAPFIVRVHKDLVRPHLVRSVPRSRSESSSSDESESRVGRSPQSSTSTGSYAVCGAHDWLLLLSPIEKNIRLRHL